MNLLILFGVLVFAFGSAVLVFALRVDRQARQHQCEPPSAEPMWLGDSWAASDWPEQ